MDTVEAVIGDNIRLVEKQQNAYPLDEEFEWIKAVLRVRLKPDIFEKPSSQSE